MKIYLDAGHNYSGVDTGAQGNGLREQDITHGIAVKTGVFLENAGVQVRYSRPNLTDSLGKSVNESLNLRCSGANSWNADYCISIHCNASDNAAAKGTEVLVYKKGGQAEKLASDVLKSMITAMGTVNRGIKEQNTAICRLTNMPAILIETGFITNLAEAAMMRDRQQMIAKSIAGGVLSFLGLEVQTMSNVSDWAKESVEQAIKKGIIKGDENGKINPQQPVTREELCVILDRLGLMK